MEGMGKGYGKIILFNEHFVVYGVPAIAAAMKEATIARVVKSNKFELVDNRPETPGYKKEKKEQQKDSMRRIMKAMNLDLEKNPVKIILEGDLVAASGVGASAASCVAIARALSSYFNLNLDDEQINSVAYEGEKGYHGNPSGIDNTVATYGGIIWFQRREGGSIFKRIILREPLRMVIGNTGKVADTKKAVQLVRERKEKEPEKFESLFKEAEKLAFEARDALESFDMERIGSLMNKNHQMLKEIGVSSEELDFLVELALENGAYGAKLTGGGLGGNMIALTPEEEIQDKVAEAMEREGFQARKTLIGGA